AQQRAGYDPLTQGAGFLNTLGAVRLADFYAHAQSNQPVPVQKMWSKHILWGNHMIKGGLLKPTANAYRLGVVWGAGKTDEGDNVVWGSQCTTANCGASANDLIGYLDNVVWGSSCADAACDNMVWGSSNAQG